MPNKENDMNQLTPTQETILKAAATRPGGDIEPLPATINAGLRPRVIQGLLSRGLIDERDGGHRISEAGFAAIGMTPPPAAKPPRQGTKQARLIGMLQRPEGASIDEICAETGWQKHTVRGVFSNTLRKRLGLTISSHKDEGQPRRYQIKP
jgi:hypothetical protein